MWIHRKYAKTFVHIDDLMDLDNAVDAVTMIATFHFNPSETNDKRFGPKQHGPSQLWASGPGMLGSRAARPRRASGAADSEQRQAVCPWPKPGAPGAAANQLELPAADSAVRMGHRAQGTVTVRVTASPMMVPV